VMPAPDEGSYPAMVSITGSPVGFLTFMAHCVGLMVFLL